MIRHLAPKSAAVGSGVMNIASQDRRFWLFALLIVSTAGCSRQNPSQTEEVRPVKTMVVGAGDASYVRYFPGRVEATRAVDLAFQVPGLVAQLPVKEGQRVARGQMVSQLRQDEFQARNQAARGQLDQGLAVLDALELGERSEEQMRREAQLRAADAKLANARTEFERYTRLLPSGAVSTSDYQLNQTAYRVAEEERKAAQQLVEKGTAARVEEIRAQQGQVHSLESRVKETKVQLDDTTLRAPFSGVIAQRLIDQGEAVTANKPIVKFQNTEEIDIVVDVPETVMAAGFRQANIVRMVAEFSHAPGQQFPVEVREIAQVADPATQTFQVRFGMKTPPRTMTLPGMTATVAVTYRQPPAPKNRAFVPISAVTKQDTGQQVVWVLGPEGTVRCRAVAMGELKDGRVEIVDGLRSGERIAVAGAVYLRDGMKVRDLGDALGDARQ
ncbi:MAG TPA: efflux RND transporter periplasmic adaptor subunit [Bryobacteraceae bacterium]|nr:efflux RND transporter periplasmic adaptor subunit [Bryobacteraceae bacterium]